ncbi:MAG: glutamine-hydrolyzing carbamoyl-phosphate synthase small subunit [Vampirovibrionales bacterium]|jgi:carbamoyl-phosphate synthase small subunit|nr:glutamine-hydrolyzing carbamoyl-phosphate synthase small subunit [Vampirovibrionales bacterium]
MNASSTHDNRAWLVLENGTIYEGSSIGKRGESFGELVFNTACTGYQEILTDPSYKGQVVMMTSPEMGNTGINTEDMESTAMHASGFVVRRLSKVTSNWRAAGCLDTALKYAGIVGIEGVDTRAITRSVRSEGALKCGITTNAHRLQEFLEEVKAQPSLDDQDLVFQVCTPKAYTLKGTQVDGHLYALNRLVAVDYGIKQNILRQLQKLVAEIVVLPATATYEEVLAYTPDAVFLSNGPGDPRRLGGAVTLAKRCIDNGLPIFGICLGHQILSLALGLSAEKMPFGHHGGNHPVKDVELGVIYITSQNHSYGVCPPTDAHLAQEILITHVNLNDGTVEGMRHQHLPVMSVQFHPEASPGPEEASVIFHQFVEACANAQVKTAPAEIVVS